MKNINTYVPLCFFMVLCIFSGCSGTKQNKTEAIVINVKCQDFTDDAALCNRSRDIKGQDCQFSTKFNLCILKADIEYEQEEETISEAQKKEIKEHAQQEAQRLLSHRSIFEYCQKEELTSPVKSEELYKAIHFLTIAADKPEQFCAEQFLRLKNDTNLKCTETLISACMDPQIYGRRFLDSLVKLKNSNKDDGSYINNLARDLLNQHLRQLSKGVWGLHLVPSSFLSSQSWIKDSPRYDNAERTKVSSDLSENLVKGWGETIASAEEFVDITSLGVPQGPFKDELKNSIKILDKKDKKITIRILLGVSIKVIGLDVDVKKLLREIESELRPSTKLKIYIASYASSELINISNKKLFSWNHSKIVAADGKLLFTGGHNLFDAYFDTANPVHDISLQLPGDIALTAHRFCDLLWVYALKTEKKSTFIKTALKLHKYGDTIGNRPKDEFSFFDDRYLKRGGQNKYDAPMSEQASNIISDNNPEWEKVIAVGRLGNAFKASWHHLYNVSDQAKKNMIAKAQTAIYISQQAIYPIIFNNNFNISVIQGLINAMVRGIDVFILKSSNLVRISGKVDAYNSGKDRAQTFWYFYREAKKLFGTKDFVGKLFRHLSVLDTANGKDEVPNHAKVLIVDTKATSVGSHNLYDDSHAEFEVILRNTRILLDYYAGLWFSSLLHASGQKLQSRPNLLDYRVGNYVFIQRDYDQTNVRRGWTLGRVAKVFENRLEVETDFLIEGYSKMQTITDPKLIYQASEPITKSVL